MRSLLIIAALALGGCNSVQRVDGVVGGGSLGRHHGYGYVGPRVYFRDDSTLTATGGMQPPVFAPGEPKVSSRAPSREVQFEITYTRPLWRRR